MNVRKEYASPRVVHTETLEARAVSCTKSNDSACGSGPIQS